MFFQQYTLIYFWCVSVHFGLLFYVPGFIFLCVSFCLWDLYFYSQKFVTTMINFQGMNRKISLWLNTNQSPNYTVMFKWDISVYWLYCRITGRKWILKSLSFIHQQTLTEQLLFARSVQNIENRHDLCLDGFQVLTRRIAPPKKYSK